MDGFLLVHGKGSGPELQHCSLAPVADELAKQGFLVSYESYPWSSIRNYDATSMQGAEEMHQHIEDLKSQGATRIHIIGHSLGGNMALYYSTLEYQDYDSIIATCPAHNLHLDKFQNLVGWSVDKAKHLIDISDDQPSHFVDFQMGRVAVVEFLPEVYVSYFDAKGPCNMINSVTHTITARPVYIIVGELDILTVDVDTLIFDPMLKDQTTSKFEMLPNQSHASTPGAAVPKILEWVKTVQ